MELTHPRPNGQLPAATDNVMTRSVITKTFLVGCDPVRGDFLLGLVERNVAGADVSMKEILKLILSRVHSTLCLDMALATGSSARSIRQAPMR